MRGLALLSLVLVAGVLVADVPPRTARAASTAAAPAGVIAFVSDRTGTPNVYLANADGSATRQLTRTGGYSPAWSPNGKRLAFVHGGGVYVVGADGTNERRVAWGFDETWSPGGRRLAFVRAGDVYVVSVNGTGERRLTRDARRQDVNTLAGRPSWSPDGSTIAFERYSGLFVVDVRTAKLTRLFPSGAEGYADAPSWSADGRAIAFVADCNGCAEGSSDSYILSGTSADSGLHVLRLRSGADRLIPDTSDVWEFALSPDGRTVAYSRPLSGKDDAPYEVFTSPASGGAATRVTRGRAGESAYAPIWSPDGRWLAYQHGRFPARFYAESYDVAVVSADGRSQREITSAFPSGGSNDSSAWASGTIGAAVEVASPSSAPIPTTPRVFDGGVFEIAGTGTTAAVISTESELPLSWDPATGRIAPPMKGYCTGPYDLVSTTGYAAWFCADAHGLTEPVTDVTLMVASLDSKRPLEVSSITRSGHNPPYETGPRLAGDGSVLVYNPDSAGSTLFRVDTSGAKPRLRALTTRLAVEDVDQDRIVGWRGATTLVTVGTDGRVVGAAPFTRARTTSVVLDGPRLFTTSGYRLTLSDLQGQVEDTWPLVAEGGWAPTLAGVEGDLAVYVSGAAAHLIDLSTRSDVRLELPQPGPSVDVDLTPEGLFYGYDAPYTRQPGRLGYVALQDLVAVASGSLNG